jgi:hypothetical protein
MIPLDMDFSDAQQCLSLLANLPLTNVPVAHDTLSTLIGAMQNLPPPAAKYLEVLEAVRAPLAFVQGQLAERYSQKPLPPLGSEDETLRRVVVLWQAMARSYRQVAKLAGGAAADLQRSAIISHRCIHYSGKVIIEYFRARRELPRGVWSDLHGYYSAAEQAGIAATPAREPLNEDTQIESCAAAYAAILLVDLANPFGRSPRELNWICRWAQLFASLTRITSSSESDPPRMYGVDLLLDRGLRLLEQQGPGENLRRLDTSQMAQEIQRILHQLKRKVAPKALGLGEDCQEPASGRLLLQLFRPWCLLASGRRFPRRSAAGLAQLCRGFDSIHYYITGGEFTQPDHVRVYSREDFDAIVTFRYQVDPSQPLHVHAAQMGFVLENWQVVDQSVSGFRLQCSEPGGRIEYGDLAGLRPPDGGGFLLCRVSWLMYEGTGSLFAGVYVLPGLPQGIGARPRGLSVPPSEPYVRAFLLPAVPALKEQPSLVLPRGWYRPERLIEIYTDRPVEVRLSELLTQGSNFDRVSFAPA